MTSPAIRPRHLEIIIPVFNEIEVLHDLTERLASVFTHSALQRVALDLVSCTFIDDGSTDDTAAFIENYLLQGKLNGRLLRLSRNFGHQSAVSAGFSQSVGDLVAVIDADLQDPPEVILEMVLKQAEGYEVVYGVRKKRKEGPIKKSFYWAFYRIYSFLSPIRVPLDSGDFALMTQRVVTEINKLSETLRFPRGLRSWVGFRQTGLLYERAKRDKGASKYGFGDLYNLATHGIISMSIQPLRLAQVLATVYMTVSVGLSIYLFGNFFGESKLSTDTNIILLFGAVSNALIMGILHLHGAYIGRGYLETKGRPSFIIDRITSNIV